MSVNLAQQVRELQTTLTKMQVTLDAIADAIVWVGQNGHVQWCNSSFERLVKQPHKSILNQPLNDLLLLKQAGQEIGWEFYPCAGIFAGNYEPTEYELDRGECVKVLQFFGHCLNLAEEDKIAILTIRDVTQQKHLEAEHRQVMREREESLSQLRATLDSTADGIVLVDLEGNTPVYNQKIMQMWSLPEYLMLPGRGQERVRFIAEQAKDPEAFLGKIRELCVNHPETSVLDIVELKDGRVVERYSQPQWQGNQIIGRVWSFRDVTERIKAEQALLRDRALLQASTEAGMDGILVIDENRKVALYNQRYCQIWQIPEAILQSSDSQKLLELLLDKLEQPQEFVNRVEYLYNHPEETCHDELTLKDGRTLDRYSTAVRSPQGEYYGRIWYFRDITECTKAEKALQQSESKFRTIVETANSIILRWDRKGNIKFLNEYGLRFFGFNIDEIKGRNVVGTIVPETETSGRDLQDLMDDICHHPENYIFNENENICKNGNRVWIVWANKPILDERGQLVEILSVGTDATKRKQTEEALRRSELKYRRIFENSLVGIGRSRLQDGLFLDINQPCAEIIGYSSVTDLIGKRYAPDFHVDSEIRPWILNQLQQHGEVRNLEIQLRRQDGSIAWGLMSARINAEDSCLEFMIADISDRKRLEEERQHAELERKKADEALQTRVRAESLLSSISRQFIDREFNTAITFTLKAIAQFIGAERACIFEYTENQSQVGLIYEWSLPCIQPLSLSGQGGAVERFSLLSEILHNKAFVVNCVTELPKNSTERALFESHSIQSVIAVPMTHKGSVVGFLGADVVNYSKNWSKEDINLLKLAGELIAIGKARHQVEEALRVAKEAAEAANRAKSAFLANMSHELRTPLNAILGFAQLMERDTALTTKQRESLATINCSGEHLLNLINDVLEMSKIEAGHSVLHPEPFDLHHLLQTLHEMFLLRTQAKQLLLKFEIASDVPQYVYTDQGKLRQVLINLLGNAVKFTHTGEVTLRVKLGIGDWGMRAGDKGDKGDILRNNARSPMLNRQYSIAFEIEDTGRGIAPEEMEHLFQPFVQTTSGTQAKEGTGLGLTISREFARLMGGDIYAESTPGQGAIFRFKIQLTLAEPQEVTTLSTRGRVLQLAPNQPKYRILVVDDRRENRDLIAQLLSLVGFDVQCATNGQEAIALWETWQPHLIWMDMRMPVMNGYEATAEIRRREQQWETQQRGLTTFNSQSLTLNPRSQTTIIALTASAFEEQQANILAVGCDDLVRKPFREQVIFEKMAQYLGVRYLYAKEPEKVTIQAKGNRKAEQSLKVSDLNKIMPSEWTLQLHQAAIEVDGNRIAQLLEEIPETHSEIAGILTELLRHFCFDEILNLLEVSDAKD